MDERLEKAEEALQLFLNVQKSNVEADQNDARTSQQNEELRKLWLLKGQLFHNLPETKLARVLEEHRSQGKVPMGYRYPELL